MIDDMRLYGIIKKIKCSSIEDWKIYNAGTTQAAHDQHLYACIRGNRVILWWCNDYAIRNSCWHPPWKCWSHCSKCECCQWKKCAAFPGDLVENSFSTELLSHPPENRRARDTKGHFMAQLVKYNYTLCICVKKFSVKLKGWGPHA